jgi:hypothetical protein
MSKACKRPDHESSLNLGAPYEADTKIEWKKNISGRREKSIFDNTT